MPDGDGAAAQTVRPTAAQPIRDAATLILYRRRSGGGLEVLMGERHGASAFMPNRFVFPGGRLDPADYRMRPAQPLSPISLARLGRSRKTGPRKATALALAAIRETFEESGLRLAAPAHGAITPPSPAWTDFCAGSHAPDPGALLYICRAITPPGRPRRFDARFFAAPAEAASGTVRPSAELDKLDWIAPEDTGGLLLPGITQYVLAHLAAWLEPGALDDPARQVPFHFMRHGRRQLAWE
ncbi:NUDIX hydrolase [Ferrovibrio xuzhouensis]|uniref:NUDIX hydrolase n=1 Tax=Ferrovibrio xuzhouensis TaxID=1576914 RepID=A0ABV7VK83_9PROT